MNETHTTIVGTVITDPITRATKDGDEVVNFRVAANARRWDSEAGDWTDSGSLYASVSCWRRLVKGVGGSLVKGDPVVVYGQLRTVDYLGKDGVERSTLELKAIALGPDLARCSVTIDRRRRVAEALAAAATTGEARDEADDADDTETELSTTLAG